MTDVMDAHVVQPGLRVDALPGAVDVGHVRAGLGSRNDPRIDGDARQGHEHADRRRPIRNRPKSSATTR